MANYKVKVSKTVIWKARRFHKVHTCGNISKEGQTQDEGHKFKHFVYIRMVSSQEMHLWNMKPYHHPFWP